MATEEIKEMPKSWAMVGGDGPQSYTQNSSYAYSSLDDHDDDDNDDDDDDNSNTRTLWHVRQNRLFFFTFVFFSVLLFDVELIGVSF